MHAFVPRRPWSKTHRYLEALGVLVALGQAWPLVPLGLFSVTTIALVGWGWWRRAHRHPGWVALGVTGLATLVLSPFSAGGLVLCLLSAFLVFDSGWVSRRRTRWLIVLAVLVGSAQLLGLAVHPTAWVEVMVRSVLGDGLVWGLVRLFRADLMTSPPEPRRRPVLDLIVCGLTSREVQLAHMLWGGLSLKEASGQLDVQEGTARNHLSQVYRKLGVAGLQALLLLPHTHRIVVEGQADGGVDSI